MQPVRPTAAVAPSQPPQLGIARPYYRDLPDNVAPIKPYQMTEATRGYQQSFPYEYRSPDPRGTPPHPQAVYGTPPPPGTVYHQSGQNRPSPKTGSYYGSTGVPNGYDHRNVALFNGNGDHKAPNTSTEIAEAPLPR